MTHLEFTCSDEKAAALLRASRLYDEGVQPVEWISVHDRLPEEGQLVAFIPISNPGSVYVGRFSCVGKGGGVMFNHREGRFKSNYYAKYWLQLPEPPKE